MIATVCLGGPAQAEVQLAQCTELEREVETAEIEHRDEGEGVVSYMIFSDGLTEVTQLFVLDCASGDTAATNLSMVPKRRTGWKAWMGGGGYIEDHREEVLGYFDEVRRSGGRITPDVAMARLTEVGATAFRNVTSRERCACAAAYPELRGSKIPYEAGQ